MIQDSSSTVKVMDHHSDEDRFLKALDDEKGHAGNVTLQRKLRWPEEKYWEVRNRLVDAGKIGLGRGRGGSIHRLGGLAQTSSVTAVEAVADVQRAENDLYEPIAKVLKEKWLKILFRFFSFARRDHRATRASRNRW